MNGLDGLEIKQIVHCEQTTMLSCIFCSKHSTKGKATTIVSIVCNSNLVGIAVPSDTVDARNLIATLTIDTKFIGRNISTTFYGSIGLSELTKLPAIHPVYLGCQFFCQSDGCATGMVEFVDVMNFVKHRRICRELVHNSSQIAIYSTEYSNSKTKVGTPEKGLTFFGAHTSYLIAMFLQPSSAAAYHFHIVTESTQIVIISNMGSCKFDGNIGTLKLWTIEVLLVINIYDGYNLVTATEGYFLYHTTHLTVTYKSYFHIYSDKNFCKDREYQRKSVLLLCIFKIYTVEKLLHYVWKHKLLPLKALLTTDGQEVEIIDTGLANQNAGPDFFNAKVRIGNTMWAGNVEIHLRSSDWYRHGHDTDEAYDNVILHVASVVDMDVFTTSGKKLPQLQLDIPADMSLRYETLKRTEDYPRCFRVVPTINEFKVHAWMDTLMVERLEDRAKQVKQRLQNTQGNWEWALFVTLSRNFGFGINGDAFETWANRIPLDKIGKHRDELFQIEAIFLGMAGLLEDASLPSNSKPDDYFRQLQREFSYQCHMFGLGAIMPYQQWKYLRLHPQNFPHIRLSELAWMYHKGCVTLSKLKEAVMEEKPLEALRNILVAQTPDYWNTHMMFGCPIDERKLHLSRNSQNLIIINTVIPVLYTYAMTHNDWVMREKVLDLLRMLPAEENYIMRQWLGCGLKVTTAADSQALIQLKKQYCDRNDCLRCSFGYEYLSSRL